MILSLAEQMKINKMALKLLARKKMSINVALKDLYFSKARPSPTWILRSTCFSRTDDVIFLRIG